MEEKKQKMVPKYHYDQMEKSTRLHTLNSQVGTK